ncbi:neutral zinc metallopeptidase [Bradyrhizobium barranii subsp. barranii]|uniref:Neutral zinc metallopeptidase n=1 Tax=Bradyrhizobium barranii subsp. barranii TaxID=2823807 RepID=A0A9X9Z0D7_9BRAD|nr:neutral zinc metallopeptidase [Bradyrhizobium barranii]UGX96642.1 neutral zinc metallopeptidase [Bradyrhizobium barranii subsp. barranii]
MPKGPLVSIAVAAWVLCTGGLAWAVRPAAIDPAAILRNQVDKIGPGSVVFNPPTEMTVGYQEPITVRPHQRHGVAQTEQIEVGSFMRARLFGEGFTATTSSDDAQAAWLYAELPAKSGDQTGAPRDKMYLFVSRVLGSTEEVWQAIFASDRLTYRPPRLVLYTSATYAACGLAEKIMGPFYCPDDQKVYLDLSFFQEMQTDLHACDSSGADCQLPQAYVIAHEIGHHVQNLLGIMPKVRELQGSLETEAERNRLQVLLELQADCLAGIWARKIKEKAKINASDIAAAIRTTEALGNDTLQKSALGYVVPDSFTHGSAAQRHHWFDVGYATGLVKSCNTFAGARQ